MLIFYPSEAHRQGYTVNIYSPDTDVMVLALYYLPSLGHDVTMTTGTGDTRRTIPLLPIHLALGEHHSEAILGFHALSGCDTNGRLFGKSKMTWWAVFMQCDESIIVAVSQLGMNHELSSQTLDKCEEFICKLLSPKNVALSSAAELRWYQFRGLNSNHSPDKLPPTKGSLHKHIRRAHYQCSIWRQALEADMRKGSPTDWVVHFRVIRWIHSYPQPSCYCTRLNPSTGTAPLCEKSMQWSLSLPRQQYVIKV